MVYRLVITSWVSCGQQGYAIRKTSRQLVERGEQLASHNECWGIEMQLCLHQKRYKRMRCSLSVSPVVMCRLKTVWFHVSPLLSLHTTLPYLTLQRQPMLNLDPSKVLTPPPPKLLQSVGSTHYIRQLVRFTLSQGIFRLSLVLLSQSFGVTPWLHT